MVTRKSTGGSAPKSTARRARSTRESVTDAPTLTGPSLNSAVQVLGREQTRSELATAAVVGVAAVLIEAELLPGILLGVAAMMVPKIFPGLTDFARPLVKSTIGLGYKAMAKAQRLVAEATDHAQDMLAEIKAEAGRRPSAEKRSAAE